MNRRLFFTLLLVAWLLCGGQWPPCAAGQTLSGHALALNQALANAIDNSDVAQVKQLLAQGADANAVFQNQGPVLIQAVIDLMDNSDVPDAEVRADQARHRRIVAVLLAHHADINAVDDQGITALMYAASGDDLLMTALLLAHHPDVNQRDPEGMTALTHALLAPHLDEIRLLLRHHADLNIRDKEEKLPLFYALSHPEVVQMLLDHGADPNLREPRWPLPGSTSHAAQPNGTTLLIEAMEQNPPSPSAAVIKTFTALAKPADHPMELSGSWETVAAFGRQKPVMDKEGPTELRRVALLLAHGADANAADADGWTPLMRAAFWGDLPLAKRLLAHGAKPNLRDKGGHTALDYARSAERLPLVRLLTSS